MKNIMVFDNGQDYFYDIHAVSDEDFIKIFPQVDQNVEFHDDLYKRSDIDKVTPSFKRMWYNRRKNTEVKGLHGMLFYENWDRKPFYPLKQDIAASLATIFTLADRQDKTILIVDRQPSQPIVACRSEARFFDHLFKLPGQDVVFYEDIAQDVGGRNAQLIVQRLKNHVVAKTAVQGIDGTLYIGYPERRMYFRDRVDLDVPRHYPLAD